MPQSEDIKLFRSLNMANAAALLPAGADATMLDIGRSVALWSSAFEILAPAKREAYLEVYALLDKNTWHYTPCKELKYEAYGFARDQTLRIFHVGCLAQSTMLATTTCTAIRSTAIVLSWRQQKGRCTTMRRYSIEWPSLAFIDLQYIPSPKRDDETEYEAYLRNHHVFWTLPG